MNNSAFISYRRDVSAFIARAIFQDLRSHDVDVFMDIESIDSGQFDSVILNQIAARPYFLLVLTPGTLDRCKENGDWLLREMNHAISLSRVIIPLVTPNFDFGDTTKFLTEPLASELPRFNAVNVPHDYFDAAMERLRTRFLKPVDLKIESIPSAEEQIIRRKLKQISTTPLITQDQLKAQGRFEQGLARPAKNLNEKIADYDEAIRLNPTDANIYYKRAIAHFYKGNLDAAISDYDMTIEINSQDSEAYYSRAIARKDKGDINGAIADYGEAIRLNPNNSKYYFKRGSIYYDNQNYVAAIDDFTYDIGINPSAEGYNNRGEAYFANGQYAQALSDFQKAVDLDHESTMSIAGFAVSLHVTGQAQTAQKIWQTLLAENNNYLDAAWVGEEFKWATPLIEEAQKLINDL